jgi:hypothetical protein
MALNSSRLPIAQGLVLMLQGVMNTTTGLPLYNYTKLGAIFDPSPYASWCEVVDPRGKAGHAGSGGNQIGWRVEDTIVFRITGGWIYDTDSTAAMVSMLTAQDILLPILMSHCQIPLATNPSQPIASVYNVLEDQGQTDSSAPVKFPNGHLYLLWTLQIAIQQQYNVQLVSP